jgi:hypothetical protein
MSRCATFIQITICDPETGVVEKTIMKELDLQAWEFEREFDQLAKQVRTILFPEYDDE